jgi:hypothetical protein
MKNPCQTRSGGVPIIEDRCQYYLKAPIPVEVSDTLELSFRVFFSALSVESNLIAMVSLFFICVLLIHPVSNKTVNKRFVFIKQK